MNQSAWRFCGKCTAIFFDGRPDKGSCPTGGAHAASGFNFVLPHDVPETANAQSAWRFCGKCTAMFFDGRSDKGICPGGPTQSAWRFCGKCTAMFFDGRPDKGICPAGGGGHTASGFNFVLRHDVSEAANAQSAWRFCGKCTAMFFDGRPDKGTCPAGGGGHTASGFNFVLPHDVAETANTQSGWRFCGKCTAMFFDGRPDKGTCPASGGHTASGFNFVLPHDVPEAAGGGHTASGFNFVLPHDLPETANAQPAWRFCGKCTAMFFDGRPDKGTCPASGGHTASGFNFVLPHDILETPSAHLTLDLAANPDHLEINPELVITGRGFTNNGRFHYTIHNWPKIQDIHNQGATDANGSFTRTESRDFASIGFDVDVPDIEVTAVDEGTGRSIMASVSAEKFIARHG
jgi:hypothetical protein